MADSWRVGHQILALELGLRHSQPILQGVHLPRLGVVGKAALDRLALGKSAVDLRLTLIEFSPSICGYSI